MTEPATSSDPAPRRAQHDTYADLRNAVGTVVALSAIGALLGLIWSAWSPPGPAARVLGAGSFIPDETESFVAADGRYLVIVTVVGLVVGLLAWRDRAHRGPLTVLGLIAGAVAGAALTELVGHLTGGGSFSGVQYLDTGVYYTARLPLSLHAQGLLLVEPVVVALVYGLLVAFAVDDDLSRPDPVRARLVPASVGAGPTTDESVGAGAEAQDGGRDGDAAGPLQQRDLPPQQPRHPY